MKKIMLLVMSILLLTGCKRDDNKLILATEAGFAPYEYYQDGEIVGVDIDIAREIALSLGKELVIKDVSFDFIINEIKSGKSDIGAAGMSITKERLEEVDFSVEYAVSNQVVIVPMGSKITSIDQISNQRIAVQLGTVADSYVNENYKDATVIRQKKYLSMVEDLKAGKVDLIIMDLLPASEIVKSNDGLKILDEYLFTDKYGMAIKKGNKELLDKVNDVLTRLMSEGKIEEYTIKHTQ
ncbi:MAG: ABC transporter substrate-binding protein [Bacilli bacterium]|nr:ABC transporter substrate-binding protein [Clostridium sp.]MDY3797833.1 ABC transporter substrate-binding protein [Bacilli bacterium]